MHWDTRTTQGGDGTRYAGVIDDMFELNTYVHIVWTHTGGDMDTFYKNGQIPDDEHAQLDLERVRTWPVAARTRSRSR